MALVPTRYGEEVVGGSEALLREVAHGLADRGWEVEVLTTTARDHHTWHDEYPAGAAHDGKVMVRRFRTVHDGDRATRNAIEHRIQQGRPVSLDDQHLWVHGTFRVPDLFHHLVASGDRYDAVVLSPYLFWTTVCCSKVRPSRTIVMPCLHDEHYAYLDIFRPILGDVAQLWFLSEPEHELAHRLAELADHRVTGAGVHVPEHYDADGFRRRHALGDAPIVYYGGRREDGKGWGELLAAFERAVVSEGADLTLLTTGSGQVDAPDAVADRVVDLGHIPDEERHSAYAAATAYVQPSRMESFSRAIMEAWLAGTAVIANGAGAVVRWHVDRSGAGVVYEGPDELTAALALVSEQPSAFRALAAGGRDYVLENYQWPRVLDAMESALADLIAGGP